MADTIQIDRAVVEQVLEAMEMAENGLTWYKDMFPDQVHECDNEASAEIDAAKEALRAALQSQQSTRTLLEQYDLDQSPEYRKGYEDGRLKGYEVGHRHATEALQSQQACAPKTAESDEQSSLSIKGDGQAQAAPSREVVFGGPEVRARMLEAGLPTADDHAKLAAGRGGVSPPHQADTADA